MKYIPTDTHIGITSIPYKPGYLVIVVDPPWNHPFWCYDMHLSGAGMLLNAQ